MEYNSFDRIIIGAGLYGLYAAVKCGGAGERVLVVEKDENAFCRATYVNQARVHMGYHYPRSLSTASRSAGYFRRFCEDYSFCIKQDFSQIYATSDMFSWTGAAQFTAFCEAAGIPCDEVPVSAYFNPDTCDGAFLTEEYTYDALILREYYLEHLGGMAKVKLLFGTSAVDIFCNEESKVFEVSLSDGEKVFADKLVNCTYASTNQISEMVRGIETEYFDIKYELCEIILVDPSRELRNIGITVMDGPFFSIMPFGRTGMHSLTSVSFTPHVTSYDRMPEFECQNRAGKDFCSPGQLGNCNACKARPQSAWTYMDHLAKKYMLPKYDYKYVGSLFSMKPILKSSEVDDSRPTAIRVDHRDPDMISILSGKINTVYDIDEYL